MTRYLLNMKPADSCLSSDLTALSKVKKVKSQMRYKVLIIELLVVLVDGFYELWTEGG